VVIVVVVIATFADDVYCCRAHHAYLRRAFSRRGETTSFLFGGAWRIRENTAEFPARFFRSACVFWIENEIGFFLCTYMYNFLSIKTTRRLENISFFPFPTPGWIVNASLYMCTYVNVCVRTYVRTYIYIYETLLLEALGLVTLCLYTFFLLLSACALLYALSWP